MGCLFAILALITPRFVVFMLCIFTHYLATAYGSWFWPTVGFFFAELTIVGAICLWCSIAHIFAFLVFLVVIHKLEYLLNSKIIGDRIRNPVWLTLIALILGERLMGIPGLILAPVVLNYLRVEMLTVEVPARCEEVEVLSR